MMERICKVLAAVLVLFTFRPGSGGGIVMERICKVVAVVLVLFTLSVVVWVLYEGWWGWTAWWVGMLAMNTFVAYYYILRKRPPETNAGSGSVPGPSQGNTVG